MNTMVHLVLSWPITVRAAILLAVPLVCWWILSKPILYTLSFLPYVLKKLSCLLYLLLEWPLSILHKAIGGHIAQASNGLARGAQKVFFVLDRWYQLWHSPKKKYVGQSILLYLLCLGLVSAPVVFKSESASFLSKGQTLYLETEGKLVCWLEEHGQYSPFPALDDQMAEPLDEPQQMPTIPLSVFGTSVSLAVREFPTTQNSTTLSTVGNGEIVFWTGELTFGIAEGKTEPWAKVITETGEEGWVRLRFLQPTEGANVNFFLT